ncbi:MAG: hypothetical protein H6711_16895 [Myxococcales bacterium]|nr:hypothetical protein [Myxococcales bacterium]
MTRLDLSRLACALAATALFACSSDDSSSGSESASSSDTSSTSSSSASTTNGGSASMSGTDATTSGGGSDSATTGTSASSDTQTSDATSASSGSTGTTAAETDSGTSSPMTTTDTTTDTTTGTSGDTTGDTTGVVDTTGGDTTGGCVPSEEICNDIDDDCNGLIDDVDVMKDGICDCLNIVIVGNKGANPSSQFENWLMAQGTKVDRIHKTANEVFDADTLAPYDIAILDWLPRTYTAQEAAALEAFIAGGGGMMSLTGFTNNQQNANVTNSLISSIGLTYNTSKGWFSGPITNFAPHPITMGLTSIPFYGGLYINIMNDGIGVNQTIMTLPQGPVGVVQERKAGRAFVFGDEWVEFDSQWQNIPQIKQFWVQTLKWIGPQESCILPM